MLILFLSPGPRKLFLDVADDGDGDVDAAEGDGDQDADALTGERKTITKRITRVELNKRVRRKTEADAKKLEVLSKQIDSLPNILEEIAAKHERFESAPCRLGRHKYISNTGLILVP